MKKNPKESNCYSLTFSFSPLRLPALPLCLETRGAPVFMSFNVARGDTQTQVEILVPQSERREREREREIGRSELRRSQKKKGN